MNCESESDFELENDCQRLKEVRNEVAVEVRKQSEEVDIDEELNQRIKDLKEIRKGFGVR